jgi:hypothetical protein
MDGKKINELFKKIESEDFAIRAYKQFISLHERNKMYFIKELKKEFANAGKEKPQTDEMPKEEKIKTVEEMIKEGRAWLDLLNLICGCKDEENET